ncbi:MAG: hypothetical protein MR779_03390 [Tenericutes bacterium]|nr:hypothetical protein [Mycoplasmatota bacterium]
MKRKKELIVILSSLLVIVLSVSVAYFTTKILGTGKDISVASADLKITFTSGSGTINGTNIEPGWTSGENTFTVKNESNGTYKYNIIIKDLVNTFVTTGFLQYKITSSDGGYNMTEFVDVPKSSTPKDEILAYSVEIAKGKTHSYSIEFKYTNSTNDQSDDMGKELSGTLYIEKGTEKPFDGGTLAEAIKYYNPTIKTRTNFNSVFTETNTGTLYKATESIAGSTPKDVYYYAGDARNNWIKFGKLQTDNIIYRGYSSNPDFPGYIDYSTMDECTSAPNYNYNCTAHKIARAGDDIYWRIIRTNLDGSVRLLYAGTSPDTTKGYIGTSQFNSAYDDQMYVGYMYGTSGSLANNRLNTNNSTIKTYIDTWYSNNLTSYTKYISTEAVYCNDRKAPSYNASDFNYYAYTRLNAGNPTYDCEDSSDAFSGSTTGGGNGKLTYPIGLMTVDELVYAGGKVLTSLTKPFTWYYLNSTGGSIIENTIWWSLSPNRWDGTISHVWHIVGSTSPGFPDFYGSVESWNAVRPAISLKACTLWASGNGAPETPYEIVLDPDISC